MSPLAVPDHLVLAATTLAQGIDWIGDLTGATARPGGKHVAMGTHNALLKLGQRLYLEIIAIDPHGTKPLRPRWFDLDQGDLRADLLEHPQLIHWVARTLDLAQALAQADYDPGPVLPFERGPYRWRITVPDDGSRPGRGILPTLIQWDVAEHPADALPDSGLSLEQIAASHADPDPVRRSLARLGLGGSIHVTYDRVTRLAAMLRTPRGLVAL